jgi:hypothetical protein
MMMDILRMIPNISKFVTSKFELDFNLDKEFIFPIDFYEVNIINKRPFVI